MNNEQLLSNQRRETLKEYVRCLGKGSREEIFPLFAEGAMITTSTSARYPVVEFYTTLLTQTISHTKSTYLSIFETFEMKDLLIVYFDYSWRNEKGKQVSARFLDLVKFQANSEKIESLSIFSNTFEEEIMKQL